MIFVCLSSSLYCVKKFQKLNYLLIEKRFNIGLRMMIKGIIRHENFILVTYLQECYTTTYTYQNVHMFANPFLHLIFAALKKKKKKKKNLNPSQKK